MKFTKFGKALLMSALSTGVVLSISSCVQSYSVGFLYVTGNVTAQTTGNGIISGFKIDHNTGKLSPIAGLPVSSGGANPGRAILLTGGRFIYVLNRGTTASGSFDCTPTDPCTSANITQFSIGGNGVLSPQQTFTTQGNNPFRLVADSAGNYLYVLDHDAPNGTGCSLALGPSVTKCGDITAFKIDPTTGRLSLIVNAQVTSASGAPLPYFPVPANPIDMALASSSALLTISGTPATGDSVFPYTYNPGNGQLTVNQNSSQPLGISQATGIVVAGGVTYVMDNEPPSPNTTGAHSQLLAYTLGTNGALQAQVNGIIPIDPSQSNPVYLIAESKGKFLYLANQGNNTDPTNAQSGLSAFQVLTPFQLTPIPNGGQTSGTGAGPQCLLEDPSNQFVYTGNFNSSTVTGSSIDQNSGNLKPLSQTTKASDTYTLKGPAAWCIVTGRTS
jgi:6-phosphogluconolactonase (cycloisomerase 2 family)